MLLHNQTSILMKSFIFKVQYLCDNILLQVELMMHSPQELAQLSKWEQSAEREHSCIQEIFGTFIHKSLKSGMKILMYI